MGKKGSDGKYQDSGFMRGVEGGYGQLRGQFGASQVNAQFYRTGVAEAAQYSMAVGGGGIGRLIADGVTGTNNFGGMDGNQMVARSGGYGYNPAEQNKISKPWTP